MKKLMRISVGFVMCAMLLFSACTKQNPTNEYSISGNIANLDVDKGWMAIKDTAAEYGYRFDSIMFENGNFEYANTINEPEVLRITFRSEQLMKKIGRGYIPTNSAYLMYVAYPGANIKVNGSVSDYFSAYPTGDNENDLLKKLNSAIFPLMNENVNLYLKSITDSTLSEEQKTEMNAKSEQLGNEIDEAKMNFLEQHVSSVAGLWLMEDMVIRTQIEMDKVAELIKKVDEKYFDLSYYKALNQRVVGFKASGVGNIAPSISGEEIMTGEEFNLASLKGKFVIIDFWGTWCGACLAGVPEMKKFRDKHADRLQIVGLAKDKVIAKVQECIKKNEMNWPNILIGKGEQDYVAKYNVQGYPTKVLLDRNGKILLRTVGESEDFYIEAEKLILQ